MCLLTEKLIRKLIKTVEKLSVSEKKIEQSCLVISYLYSFGQYVLQGGSVVLAFLICFQLLLVFFLLFLMDALDFFKEPTSESTCQV